MNTEPRSRDIAADLPMIGTVAPLRVRTGKQSQSAPLTWAQRAMLTNMQALGSRNAYFTMTREVRPWPTTVTCARAREALAALVQDFDVLRSVVRLEGVHYRQIVLDEVVVPVQELEVDEQDKLPAPMGAPWDPAEGPPLRASMLVDGATLRMMRIEVSHLAVDAAAMDLVHSRLIKRLFRDGGSSAPQWEPVDQANFERTDSLKLASRLAIERWVNLARLAHPAGKPTAGSPNRFQEWRISSEPAARAVQLIAGKAQTSPASVVLAAWCQALTETAAPRPVTLVTVIAGNRHRRRERAYVGPLAQDGLCKVETGIRDQLTHIQGVHHAALEAYSSARYDPDAWSEACSRAHVDKIRTFFNFVTDEHAERGGPDTVALETPELHCQWPYLDLSRFLVARPEGRRLGLRLLADTHSVDGLPYPAETLGRVRDILVQSV